MSADPSGALRGATRRILLQLLPPLVLAYLLLLLDRSAIALVGPGTAQALGMSPLEFGFLSPIVLLGVLFFEVPGTLLAARGLSPGRMRRWLLVLLVALGLAELASAAAPTPGWFLFCRALASLAGAAVLPPALFLVADSVPPRARSRAMSAFVLASLAVPVLASAGTALFAGLPLPFGAENWRGLFIGLGVALLLVAGLLALLVPAAPRAATWLLPAQRDALAWSRSLEPRGGGGAGGPAALLNGRLLLLVLVNVGLSLSAFAAATWFAVLMRESRAPALPISLAFIAVSMAGGFFWAWRTDRSGRVAQGLALACAVTTVAFAAAVLPGRLITSLAGLLAHGATLAAARTLLWSATSRLAQGGAGGGAGAAAFALVDVAGLLAAFEAPRVFVGLAGAGGVPQAGLLMVGVLILTAAAAWTFKMTGSRD